MIDTQKVLRALAIKLSAELCDVAEVVIEEPTAALGTAVVRVRPVKVDAASVTLLSDNGDLTIFAGNRADFVPEEDRDDDLIESAFAIVLDVAKGLLVDEYLGHVYISSSLGRAKVRRFHRLVRWPSY